MRIYLFIILVILACGKAFGQDTIYSIAGNFPQPVSYFEDRDVADYFYINPLQANNIWQIGKPSKTIFNSAYSPSLALMTDTLNNYPNGNISSFEFVIKTDDHTEISFWHKCNSDTLADGGVVEVSTNGGLSWTNIVSNPQFNLVNFYQASSTISSNGNKAGFTGNFGWKYSIIKGYSLNFVRFRFTFTSNNTNTNKEGWMLDNFIFTCYLTGINETDPNSPFQIFPNPTSNLISIRSNNSVRLNTILVKDILGKTILTTNNTTIDFSAFDKGLYFVEIMMDNKKYVSRIVRQ
ncbi:MAG: T9SS type A sorting domain-containing protein [Bacteroidetes bacterium]|nr:T9SS type A sorting domain-containing protein [Bacteroidota bacterium]